MKNNRFVIDYKLPSLNEYVKACRANKYAGAKFKSDVELLISACINKAKVTPTQQQSEIFIEWHEKTKRRDVDNIQSAQKFILDALQKSQIIENDNRQFVKNTYHKIIDDDRDFVVVEICEVTE